jgi:hypothetical protein
MAEFLTTEHFEYLRQIEVPPSAVMDARHMKRAAYQAELKRQEKGLAYVTEPCGKGHSLRLRLVSGHCAQCSSVGLSIWKTRHKPGVVYIAFSRSLGAYKVGSAQSASDRADGLNRDGYAGATDWRVPYRRRFSKAGLVESRAQTALAAWKAEKTYTRRGHGTTVKASEVFECSYDVVRAAVEQSEGLALSEAIRVQAVIGERKKGRVIGKNTLIFVASLCFLSPALADATYECPHLDLQGTRLRVAPSVKEPFSRYQRPTAGYRFAVKDSGAIEIWDSMPQPAMEASDWIDGVTNRPGEWHRGSNE